MILTIILLFSVNFRDTRAAEISGVEKEVKNILKTVSPSIVKVIFENHKRNFSSGIAIDRNHVVSSIFITQYPYDTIYIQTVEGKNFPAKLVGKDEESRLILLSIDEKALTPFEQAKNVEVGDWAALVGAFYQKFPAIYQGMISSASDEELLLNAPVVPGAAGGAVVNKKGELVGIIIGRFGFSINPDYTFRDSSGEIHIQSVKSKMEDLCYAVPVKKAVSFAEEIKKYGKVRRGWVGVQVNYNLDGLFIVDVAADSPAKKADLRKNDEIMKMNGKTIRSLDDFIEVVKNLKPDYKLSLELLRGNEKKSAMVVVGEAKAKSYSSFQTENDFGTPVMWDIPESLPQMENYVFRFTGGRTLGVEVMTLSPELAKEFNIKEGSGMMISKIYKNAAAEKAGLRVSDIIVKVNETPIKNNSDLRQAMNELEDNEPVVINIYRKGKLEKIKVTPDKKNLKMNDMFDNFQDKMNTMNNMRSRESEQSRQRYERTGQNQDVQNAKELEKYKIEIEKMRLEQEKIQKKMNEMMKLLEEKKKEEKKNDKKETNATTTKT
jgi:serine protease Do